MLNNRTILISGGTGSFGQKITERILNEYNPKKIIIFSRDEYKQYIMRSKFAKYDSILRFFIGDVRDKNRLHRALTGVDIVIHSAALKHVAIAEYNPIEAIRTNIEGAMNIVDTTIDRGVKKVVALSTDKAVNPVNLYGATKLVSDKLFISGNSYAGSSGTIFSVVRYGNVTGSRGSVVPFFMNLVKSGKRELPITDVNMTRFWITLDQGVDLVFKALNEAKGGEIYVAKIPSYKVTDLAKAIMPDAIIKEVGRREGEKLHEVMITEEDSHYTYDYGDHYIIYPHFEWWSAEDHFKNGGKIVPKNFRYSSNNNQEWLSEKMMGELLKSIEILY